MNLLIKFVIFFVMAVAGHLNAQNKCTNTSVYTEIIIQAKKEDIWQLLTNFKDYQNWHPYIISVTGKSKLHAKLKFITLKSDSSRGKFSAYLLTLDENKELAWGGSAGFLFKAKHYYQIEPINSTHIKLIQCEYWHGWFGKTFGKKIYEETCKNFMKQNQIIKAILEKG